MGTAFSISAVQEQEPPKSTVQQCVILVRSLLPAISFYLITYPAHILNGALECPRKAKAPFLGTQMSNHNPWSLNPNRCILLTLQLDPYRYLQTDLQVSIITLNPKHIYLHQNPLEGTVGQPVRRGMLELSVAMPDEELQSLGTVRLGVRLKALSVGCGYSGLII